MTAQAPHLAIHVHLLEERWHGLPDWPPAPFRLFQALLAAAAQGEQVTEEDAEALRWLEAQPAPLILAPLSIPGTHYTTFVPNNDLDAVGGDPDKMEKIRVGKDIRPRLFTRLPSFTYVWRNAAEIIQAETLQTLQAIVHRLYQFGRGVDMAFARIERLDDARLEDLAEQPDTLRYEPQKAGHENLLPVPEPGSLESLLERFRANRQRLQAEQRGRKRVVWHFRQPPKPRARSVCYACPPHMRVFDLRAAEDEAAFAPWPRTGVAYLIKNLRDAAAARLKAALPQERHAEIERYLIGRNAGKHDKNRRIRIIPLPSIGHAHAGGNIRRLLVEVPQGCPLMPDDVFWAFEGTSPEENIDWETGEIYGVAKSRLIAAADAAFAARHYRIGHLGKLPRELRWRTITPAALPAHRGGRTGTARLSREARAIHAVKQALRHAGISAKPLRIHVQREPFNRNAARADRYAPQSDPDLKERFSANRLWHAEIIFDRPLAGPLIIGDGRYLGLGLMAPVPTYARTEQGEAREAFLFHLPGDGLPSEKMEPLLKALRAALMRLDAETHDRQQACRLFSGHEPTSSKPARRGAHQHVFLAAPPQEDGRIRVIFVIPPWLADNHPDNAALARKENLHFAEITSRLRVLFGPDLPRTPLLAAPPADAARHSLFAPARIWRSATAVITTRHYRASRDGSPEHFLAEDIRRELVRRHLPRGAFRKGQTPLPDIEITDAAITTDSRVRGHARIIFHRPVPGPFLLGWQSHKGAGVFHGISDQGTRGTLKSE
ncbi:type I-U CRISPR-associated protein Csb2 [Thermopetrobacter sp. TC1]|uniref:type I-G CRISPR-associated protein Csb2 n=1 Tax=Thermopetrobacter sp. TC1 TaxID=1495045 RepID=UPI000570D83B|nr:type I-U CRISPR-associated protein Csb2 [Thermopetrobacter sp. TC1]